MAGDRDRMLLLGLGLGKPEKCKYRLPDEKKAAGPTEYHSIALIELLDLEFDQIRMIRTGGVKHAKDIESDEYYGEELREKFEQEYGFSDIDFLDIDKIGTKESVNNLLSDLDRELSKAKPDDIVVDITHAYRSIHLALLAATAQLDATGRTNLERIYYGEKKNKYEGIIIDLTEILTLLDWAYAIRNFQETGVLGPVRRRVSNDVGNDSGEINTDQATDTAGTGEDTWRERLTDAARYVDTGTPLEAGTSARDAKDTLSGVELDSPRNIAVNALEEDLDRFAFDDDNKDAATSGKKAKIELDKEELQRERDLVEFYLDRERYQRALELARELFINIAFYVSRREIKEGWLNDRKRRVMRMALDGEADSNSNGRRDKQGSNGRADPISLWEDLNDYRNYHARAGFSEEPVPVGESVEQVVNDLWPTDDDPDESYPDEEYWGEKLRNLI